MYVPGAWNLGGRLHLRILPTTVRLQICVCVCVYLYILQLLDIDLLNFKFFTRHNICFMSLVYNLTNKSFLNNKIVEHYQMLSLYLLK